MHIHSNQKAAKLLARATTFAAPEHEPFFYEHGPCVALLVHGFPGTPAEMRAPAQILQEQGWSVQGILLPGFGRDLDSLSQAKHEQWLATIDDAYTQLYSRFERVILVGNSMGGALSLQIAARKPVDGLLLFAPFYRVASWLDVLYPLARLVMPTIRPFRQADFSNDEFRLNIQRFLPGADPDDAELQAAIQEFALPLAILGEVRYAGRQGYAQAPNVQAPVRVIQGKNDPLARPRLTQQLVQRLPRLIDYVEVEGGHELTRAELPAWQAVAPLVIQTAHEWL
jgi:carboxylesterase